MIYGIDNFLQSEHYVVKLSVIYLCNLFTIELSDILSLKVVSPYCISVTCTGVVSLYSSSVPIVELLCALQRSQCGISTASLSHVLELSPFKGLQYHLYVRVALQRSLGFEGYLSLLLFNESSSSQRVISLYSSSFDMKFENVPVSLSVCDIRAFLEI